jgi:CDP-diacylglycerol--serine O-phosphatidyltransferase
MENDPRLRAVGEDPAAEDPAAEDTGDSDEPRHPRRGIYLLPNLITTGALFAGFYAIVAGMNGNFIAASIAICVAGLLDTADGRIARWTHTESQFGAEYDSLSDMVAFGVSPALVAFSWGLSTLGQIGWMVTFVYMACAALRLASYNTKGDNTTFTGLASPTAAAIVATSIWAWADSSTGDPSMLASSIMGVVVITSALLMVSPFPYYSPKLFDVKGRVPFLTLVLVALVFAILLADPPRVLLLLALSYAVSGPLQALWRWRRRKKPGEVDRAAADDDE